jgi:hypothetical protein
MALIDHIIGDYYKTAFDDWEETEQIFDDNHALWMIRKPNSEYQKVCLYRDGHFLCVYGDYGTMTFNQMTWKGTVYNLHYDNIGYQMEKLSHESREALRLYDETKCEDDIYEWLRERLENYYDIEEEKIDKVVEFLKSKFNSFNPLLKYYENEEFCEQNNIDDLINIIDFTFEALSHTDEYEWIAFLRRTNFSEFDEECESNLWDAGRCIDQRYFINMYALQKCAEKLRKEND